ncbi:MAG: AAA family ATPase [Bacteroidales bacterium]|nr:AAA family ATPase [Bacteroidales bacterium]
MININTIELLEILDKTPANQNIMLVGKHGIGKSEILTNYYTEKGFKVVALFLGQMSDPGDLIGLPIKNAESGRTEFLPPYWFPNDDEPVVLFLDELNRARPEVLQTIMDLALNRKLAGRTLPKGSRLISAVNDGEEYQLTDLDPALVSRFNVYGFRPTYKEWLLWAEKQKLDSRVTDFISSNPDWLDGNVADRPQIDSGLEKFPDRRAWKKVSDIILHIRDLDQTDQKMIAGVIGVQAAQKFYASASAAKIIGGREVLLNFDKVESRISKYKVHQFSTLNEGIFRFLETAEITAEEKTTAAANLKKYIALLESGSNKESLAHFTSVFSQGMYPTAVTFIVSNAMEVYQKLMQFVSKL